MDRLANGESSGGVQDAPRIVVVEPDEKTRSALETALRQEGYEVTSAGDLESGRNAVRSAPADLVILEVSPPGENACGFLESLRADGLEVETPVILLSPKDDLPAKIRAFDLGALEYLVKPVHPDEITARVRAMLRVTKAYDSLRQRYIQANELSLIDDVTGVYNRRFLDKALKEQLSLARRHGHSFSCAMFDVDRFKEANDTYGHAFGDLVLREVAARTMRIIRKEDAVVRYGGDEFVVLLAQAGSSGARRLAERLRKSVAGQSFDDGANRANLTISVGLATFPEDEGVTSPEDLLRVADQRLYAAKLTGHGGQY